MSLPDWWRRRLKLPLIAAPMFLITGPDLVIAACKAGVTGCFPTPNARDTAILEQWLSRISAELTEHDAPWAVNLVVHRTNNRLEDDLALCERFRVPIVITALGSPQAVIERVHGWGGIVLADVNSVKFARRAAAMGVDGLVLVGAGAGGHTGPMAGFSFVPAVREFFEGIIVLGGGITTGGGIAAAEMLGADLAAMGTRFIATSESMAADAYRDMLVASTVDDIVLSRGITGVPANWLRPSIEAAGMDLAKLEADVVIDFTDPKGDARRWTVTWSAGHGVGAIKRVEPVAELVAGFVRDYVAAGNSRHRP
jgi:nitronate monooxygenase